MTIQRMDNVLIVVDDLEAAKAFFAELGMELEGEATVEGRWVDCVVGLDDVRADIAMMRTPDGHGRVAKFHTPPAVRAEPEDAPANTLGIRRIMFAVDDIDDVVARLRSHGAELVGEVRSTRTSTGSASCVALRLRASSSDWPSSSAEPFESRPGRRRRPRASSTSITHAPHLCEQSLMWPRSSVRRGDDPGSAHSHGCGVVVAAVSGRLAVASGELRSTTRGHAGARTRRGAAIAGSGRREAEPVP
jgi:catechol 2,3-dioxygenase-like lactoylglutathione lyase family enzyme